MDDPVEYVFVTIVPREGMDRGAVRDALSAQRLPIDEQTQFAGSEAIETAVGFAREAIGRVAALARKLMEADRTEEVTIEYRGSKVTLRGVPADRAKTVDELTEHILKRLKA